MNYRDDPNAALLPDPDLYERADTQVCPYMERYKNPKGYWYWWLLVGLVGGIVLCLVGIMVIN